MYLDQNNSFFSLNLRGKVVSLASPIIMGIVNLTPDSFHDGDVSLDEVKILTKIEKMLHDGATIIDIGAMSSRPSSTLISQSEELQRLQSYLPSILRSFPDTYFSIDSYRSIVVKYALDMGVHLVNDISAFEMDIELLDVIAEHKVPYVLMHMKGTPSTMQINPIYDSILTEIIGFFGHKICLLRQKGIIDIVLDVGFGFGKSLEHNFYLLKHLSYFNGLECPIMTGISRKSMIYKPLEITSQEALIGTSALHFEALRQGSNILRVHDVKEAREVIELYRLYANS